MAMLNERELSESVKTQGAHKTSLWVKEALRKREIKLEEVSLMALAKNFICFRDGSANGTPLGEQVRQFIEGQGMTEAGTANAVSMAAFSNITQQYIYNAVLDGMNYSDFTISPELGVIGSQILQVEEKFPGISNLGDASKPIGEGQPFPVAGLTEEWINSPVQGKKGLIVPVTREAVLNDRPGLVVERANKVGEAIYLGREIEAIDTIINAGGTAKQFGTNGYSNPYVWRGTPYSVWQTDATAAPFYNNVVPSNELVDVANVSACEKVLAKVRDPLTGQPFSQPGPFVLVCTPDYRYTAERILAMMQFRTGTASSSNAIMISGSLLPAPFKVISSKYWYDRLITASLTTDYYLFGNLSRSFKFVRSLDVQTLEADERSGLAFSHDILMQFKSLRIESCSPWNPRHIVRSKAAA